MDRIAMLNNALEKEKINNAIAKQKEQNEHEKLIEQIRSLGTRIEELIKVGNAVLHAGKMPYVDLLDEKYHMDKVFISNGWSHRVGFMGHPSRTNETITHVGFYNGGACGPWDFFVNSKEVFDKHERDYSLESERCTTPSIKNMKTFLDGFDDFETRFYTWFDKRFGK